MVNGRMRRSVAVLLGGFLLAGGLAACGSDDDGGGGGEAAAPADDRRLDSPVTVEHRFGSTTIESVPERVVTLDPQWTDVMLALGVTPVGYTADAMMPDQRPPWEELPADSTALEFTDGVPTEEIIALDPDLVVGTYSLTDEESYQLLAASVPTIAGPPDDRVVRWQDLVRTAGEILAEPQAADKLVTSVEAEVAAVAQDLPGLADKTFALAQYIVGDSMYIVGDPQDGSSVFFQQLGMKIYPPVLAESERTGDARVNVSTERADLLRADLLAFLVNGGDESDLADIPGFDQLPGTVAVLDYPTIVGLNTPSPLSIPYSLKQMRPFLAEAAAATGGN